MGVLKITPLYIKMAANLPFSDKEFNCNFFSYELTIMAVIYLWLILGDTSVIHLPDPGQAQSRPMRIRPRFGVG